MDHKSVVKAYLKLRDTRTALKRQYEEEDEKLKGKMDRLEKFLLAFLQESNIDSVSTDAGTFYRQLEITPTGSDWDKFYQWVAENNAFEALERRIKKTFIKEYMDTHEGGVPPGVSVFREFVVRIRRK